MMFFEFRRKQDEVHPVLVKLSMEASHMLQNGCGLLIGRLVGSIFHVFANLEDGKARNRFTESTPVIELESRIKNDNTRDEEQ